jgi:HKD family nuclease
MPRLEESLLEWLFDIGKTVYRAVFCTYRFDPEYFVDVISPELRRHRCGRTLILMDSAQYHTLTVSGDLGAAGRVVLERYDSRKLFHPKLYLLAGNSRARCAVGSANLTRDGLETNYELFSRFKESDCDFAPLIDWLGTLAGSDRMSASARSILRESIDELKAAQYGLPERPPSPLVWNGFRKHTLWIQMWDGMEERKIKKAVIVSPYFEAPEQFDKGLLRKLLEKGSKVELYVSRDQSRSKIPRTEIEILAKRYPKQLRILSLSTQGHLLHAKLFGIMDAKEARILSGSANFTAAALTGKNIELCLLNKMPRSEGEHHLELLLADAHPMTPAELPEPLIEPAIEPVAGLSDFISTAEFSPKNDRLTILLKCPVQELTKDLSQLEIQIGGSTVSMDIWQSISDQTLLVTPASKFLKGEDDTWQLSCVHIRTRDGSANDWRLIEVAEGEELDSDAISAQAATDLETFAARLLNPRFSSPGSIAPDPENASLESSLYSYHFGDVEGGLDRVFRITAQLDAHFAWSMTDPYTIHRWRADWLRFYEIFSANKEQWDSTKRAFLSTRLLNRLESSIIAKKEDAGKWLKEDEEIRKTITGLLEAAAPSPELNTPRLIATLSVERS